MAALVLKNISPELHRQLKERAIQNHRSLTQEAQMILEAGLGLSRGQDLPPLLKGKFPLTEKWLKKAKREGLA